MKNNNKKITITFFISILITFIIGLIGLYISDPLQLFHAQPNKKGLASNARHQVAGIINSYNFDSIIMGTSMLENTSAKEASNILGDKFVNISINGSDFHTRSIILDYVLKNKEIKKIIFSLDNTGLVDLGVSDTDNFDFLYDDNKLNDIKIYLSPRYLICSIYHPYCLQDLDSDRPFSWYTQKRHIQRFGGIDNWFNKGKNNQINDFYKEVLGKIEQINLGNTNLEENYEKNLKHSQQSINTTLITHVLKYPNTEFIFILPPYSRIKYAIDSQYNISEFKRYKENIRYLVDKSKIYSNLKIYGWGNHPFVDELKNYKDFVHYEYKINSWMLDAIRREDGLLTIRNIDSYLKVFTQKSLDYNLSIIGHKIDKYLND